MIIKIIREIYRDSLLKNSAFIITTSYINSIIGFFFWILAARYYSPSDIGLVSALTSGMALITMISSLGLGKALIYYLPKDSNNSNKIINSCLITNILISLITSLIFIFGLEIFSPDLKPVLNNIIYISIFVIMTLLTSITGIIGVLFISGKRSSLSMIKDTSYNITKILPLILFVNFGSMGIFISYGFGLTVSIIIGLLLLSKVWKYSLQFKIDPLIKTMAKFSLGNYIADILYSLPKLIFPLLILNMLSDKSAGYFYIAFMMAGLLYGIPQSISTSLLVESSDKDKLSNNIDKAIKFNLVLIIPGIILFILLGDFILKIFNPVYAENAINSLIILVLTSIPLSMVNIFNTVRNAQNRVGSLMKLNFLISAITIILSITLIKEFDIEGVAISYLIANIVGAIIVINRIKNPIEYTIKLIKEVKKNVIVQLEQ